jgi:transcriptional regulator with GAF, ATPase, and Fis domain
MDPIKPLKQVQREHILRVLRSTGGDLARASRVLGVSPARLGRLVREHGLEEVAAGPEEELTAGD